MGMSCCATGRWREGGASPESCARRTNSGEGDAQARSMADAVARGSDGKLVAFLAARTRDVAAAEDRCRRRSLRPWQSGR